MLKIPFKINNQVHFISINEIVLITKVGRKTTIYNKTGTFKNYDSLQKIEEQLPEDKFFRCHKSFIIIQMYLEKSPLVEERLMK